MAYDEQLAQRIRKALSHLDHVEEKKMFGGLAFMVDNKMCVTVTGTRMMCRIDPELQAGAIISQGIEAMQMKGKEYKGYIHLYEEAWSADFDHWIEKAIEYNKIAKASK